MDAAHSIEILETDIYVISRKLKEKDMQITVKPVPSKKWHGKEGKESFAVPKGFEVLLDTRTGKYATGLTEEEAAKYGAMLGLNLDDRYHPDRAHEYWGSNAGKFKLPNHTMLFDDSRPLDFIKIKNLKASRFIANSLAEFEAGKWPDATHIIYSETEEVELKASKIQNYNKCIVILSKMSRDEKTNMMALLSDKSSKGRSENFIDVELNRLLTEDSSPTQTAKMKIEEFLKYHQMDKAELNTRAQVVEAIHRNVITKEGHSHYYMGEKLGYDFESTVDYFLDPNNQQIKIAILEKLV